MIQICCCFYIRLLKILKKICFLEEENYIVYYINLFIDLLFLNDNINQYYFGI